MDRIEGVKEWNLEQQQARANKKRGKSLLKICLWSFNALSIVPTVIILVGFQGEKSAQDFIEKGDYAQALQSLDATSIVSDSFSKLETRSECLTALGQHQKALGVYSQIIAMDPNDSWTYSLRADCLCKLKQYEAATADLDHAIKLDPKSAELYSKRAQAYKAAGKNDLAAKELQIASRLEEKKRAEEAANAANEKKPAKETP